MYQIIKTKISCQLTFSNKKKSSVQKYTKYLSLTLTRNPMKTNFHQTLHITIQFRSTWPLLKFKPLTKSVDLANNMKQIVTKCINCIKVFNLKCPEKKFRLILLSFPR
jgi:hypothetical protein